MMNKSTICAIGLMIGGSALAAKPQAKVTHKVTLNVKIGKDKSSDIVVGVFGVAAPKTALNFISMCDSNISLNGKSGKAFAGSSFHRIIPGFMIQGGDFTNHNGTGGVSIYGNKFEDEAPALTKLKHVGPGVLSMANAGPNTNGSQFFITVAATPWLDGRHVVFGQVEGSMDAVSKVVKVGSQSGKPSKKVTITDCSVQVVDKTADKNMRKTYLPKKFAGKK